MQQPKTKLDRSAYEQSVDRLASAMREMLGLATTCASRRTAASRSLSSRDLKSAARRGGHAPISYVQ
jgi:hypothetical protein